MLIFAKNAVFAVFLGDQNVIFAVYSLCENGIFAIFCQNPVISDF